MEGLQDTFQDMNFWSVGFGSGNYLFEKQGLIAQNRCAIRAYCTELFVVFCRLPGAACSCPKLLWGTLGSVQ